MRPLVFAALAVLSALALPARAQTAEVVTSVTADEMAAVVREAGTAFGVPILAEARLSPDTSWVVLGDIAFPGDSASAPDTLRFFVGLDGCEGAACSALSAVAFFGTGAEGPGPNDMNAWNATRRLTRAYVTPDGLALQSDLDVGGGVTRESVARFVRSYLVSLVTFADALQAASERAAAPPAGAPPTPED